MNKGMRGKVCGVGINDAPYKIFNRDPYWQCPFYAKWRAMLSRCYNKKVQDRQHTYQGDTVCAEWHLFSNFRSWMIKQDWEGKALDKDFVKGQNTVYSPETCIFMPRELNNFLTMKRKKDVDVPLGVSYHKVKMLYQVRCNDGNGNNIWGGEYQDKMEGHFVWLKLKVEVGKKLIDRYKEDARIVFALEAVIDRIESHIANKTELKSF